ncbi:MAG: RlmI/RlmK family 23S rRNA methyltransferase, partial [Marivivens sp.]|nr:RlmI/RlmK family 23S rRNA methyltransferase [Marivivens sp.]
MNMPSSLPIVRLMPKADARAIRFGFPWVYSNDLVTDRRTKAIEAGAIAELQDAERQPLGLVAMNPDSRIIARMLDRDTSAVIDQAWIAARLKKALDHRERVFAEPFYRLVHAEADGFPGVVIDRFGDTVVMQPNAAWADRLVPEFTAALQEVVG